MLGNSNYVDITGQIEEVFDEKIQQIQQFPMIHNRKTLNLVNLLQ